MTYLNLLKFMRFLPEFIRILFCIIFLLFKCFLFMRTFFIPKRKKFVKLSQCTPIPRFTDAGVVYDYLSDDQLLERCSVPDALSFDPVSLSSRGISPINFAGSVVSPLDALSSLKDSFDDSYDSIQSSLTTDSTKDSTDPIGSVISAGSSDSIVSNGFVDEH